jgi:L-ascorbate metabolism protein UlaG (beta-lactamase superfamily)
MLDLKGNCITYFGHSTFSLTTPSGQVALIDPWVTTNPRCPESRKKLDRLDAIFLTHAHSDHLGDLLALFALSSLAKVLPEEIPHKERQIRRTLRQPAHEIWKPILPVRNINP